MQIWMLEAPQQLHSPQTVHVGSPILRTRCKVLHILVNEYRRDFGIVIMEVFQFLEDFVRWCCGSWCKLPYDDIARLAPSNHYALIIWIASILTKARRCLVLGVLGNDLVRVIDRRGNHSASWVVGLNFGVYELTTIEFIDRTLCVLDLRVASLALRFLIILSNRDTDLTMPVTATDNYFPSIQN